MRRFALRLVIVLLVLFIGALVAFKVRHPVPMKFREGLVPMDDAPVSATPVPTPSERPWIEREGNDVFGRPKRLPDRAALLRALARGKYEALTTWLEEWQSEFEADHRRERWPSVAARAFWVADPKLTPRIDAWVAASPRSWAPLLARAFHLRARAGAARTGALASNVTPSQREAEATFNARARDDFQRALELAPTLAAAHEGLVGLEGMQGGARAKAAWEAAERACPDCALAALIHAAYLVPKWGHAPAELGVFVEGLRPKFAAVPALGVLGGAADAAVCDHAVTIQRDYVAARAACDKALRLGPNPFALHDRLCASQLLGDDTAALADADRLLDHDPQHPDGLVRRARLLAATPRALDALHDLAAAIRIDRLAVDPRQAHHVLANALTTGQEFEAKGDLVTARAILDAAFDASPESRVVRLVREKFRREHGFDDAALEAVRRRYLAEAPSLSLAADLDDALLARGDTDAILALWNQESAAAPDDPRPYVERAGTYARLGRDADAARDLARACKLGHAESCD